MSTIEELKNQLRQTESKTKTEQNNANRSVFAWNDKVGNVATDCMSETVKQWGESLDFGFQSLNISVDSLSSTLTEIEKINNELSSINITIEKLSQISEHTKE